MAKNNKRTTVDFFKDITVAVDEYVSTAQERENKVVTCPHCVAQAFLSNNTTALTADIINLSKKDLRKFLSEIADFTVRMKAMALTAESIFSLTAQVLEEEVDKVLVEEKSGNT
jgi:hypothetical protein